LAERLPGAVLFDLDETILAYTAVVDDVWQAVCDEFASSLGGVSSARLLAAFQEHRLWYWSDPERNRRGRLNPEVGRKAMIDGPLQRLGVYTPRLASQMDVSFLALRDEAIHLFPGAVETLRHFQRGGTRMALITNGPADLQRRKIERFELTPFFDCVSIEGELGFGKPDEKVYLHTLAQLDSRPEEAWMVGDHLEWDVAAPQKLGIHGIWIDSTGTGVPQSSDARPDRIIGALQELL